MTAAEEVGPGGDPRTRVAEPGATRRPDALDADVALDEVAQEVYRTQHEVSIEAQVLLHVHHRDRERIAADEVPEHPYQRHPQIVTERPSGLLRRRALR